MLVDSFPEVAKKNLCFKMLPSAPKTLVHATHQSRKSQHVMPRYAKEIAENFYLLSAAA